MGGKPPQVPDYGAAAAQGISANLENYPLQQLVTSASQMGGKVTINGKVYDFTGLGQADNAAAMSDKMAQTLLDIQQNYGPQYIQQRLDELKQSDPQGYAARQDLFDKILQQSKEQPNRPLAEDLQSSIVGQLQSAGKLDKRGLEEVQQAVRGSQIANGNYLGHAAEAQESGAVVGASEALRDNQQQQGLGFLNSGVTPEDVEYRRIQQSLSDLGAFQNGQTPTAQFRSVSAAGNGAAPFAGGDYNLVRTNPNAGDQGISNANAIYGGQMNWYQNQTNPYLATASTAVSAGNAGLNLGWKPGG